MPYRDAVGVTGDRNYSPKNGSCWIDSLENLPPPNTLVVGFHSAQLVPVVCFLDNTRKWNLVSACFYTGDVDISLKIVKGKITHWCAIPKPPKSGELNINPRLSQQGEGL